MKRVKFNQEAFDEDMKIMDEVLFSNMFSSHCEIDDWDMFIQFIYPEFCGEIFWEYYE